MVNIGSHDFEELGGATVAILAESFPKYEEASSLRIAAV